MISYAPGNARGAELKGVNMPDQVKVGTQTLVLNGLGMRQKTFLNIDIYVGALYVEKKSHDPQEILNSREEKRVELGFVHSASQSQIQDAFDEAYKANCGKDCPDLKGPFDKLRTLMAALSVGDRLAFDLYPGKVDVWIRGNLTGTIEDPHFSRGLLNTWLGEHPPTESLKQAMLGK